jgi:hypothetical protein
MTMIPGFTAGEVLRGRSDDSVLDRARWFAGSSPTRRAGAYAQDRMTLDRGGDGGGATKIATAWCDCPCCITHACGFLGLSTCLTCC